MSTADEVFETWEEMEASGALDRKLNALQLNGLDDPQNPKLVNGKNTNGRMIILGDDGMRSQYVSPKPTVKILKRPQRDGNNTLDGLANGEKPKQPIKSLKQREQEYAEARKRILGEEKSPEETTTTTAATTTITTTTTNDNGILESKTNPIFNSYIPQQQQGQVTTNVIRMPNGPVDGTTGFNVRR